MKEKLYTIPLNDAFNAHDECAFCFIERKLEQDAIDFILGSAYMESDIREATDNAGFCRHHLKVMYDYGNSLGNALMLKTHIKKLNKELSEQISAFKYADESAQDDESEIPSKTGLFSKILPKKNSRHNSLASYLNKKASSCYVCDYYKNTYDRYIDTFFHLYKSDSDFSDTLKNSNGFCMQHLMEIMENADSKLNKAKQQELFPVLFMLTKNNMARIEEDISWFVEKYDYRNKDADWKNSKDAIPRSMQKLWGGYPADGPYKMQP